MLQRATALQQFLEGARQLFVAGGIGMDGIGFKGGIAEDFRQNILFERDSGFAGNFGIKRRNLQTEAEGGDGNEDDGDSPFFGALYHGAQVLLDLRRIETAEKIVAAEAEEEQCRLCFIQGPGQSCPSFGAHFSGNTGIDHCSSRQSGEDCRITLGSVGAGSIGEAVAKGEDHSITGQEGELLRFLAGREQEGAEEEEETGTGREVFSDHGRG